ncbi:MAG: flippase [Candidatus Hydrogenedentota bacterium]
MRSAVDRIESILPGSRDAASNFAYLSIPRYVGFVVELAASIYIARKLGPENYGILATVYAFVYLFRMCTDLGTTQLAIRDVAQDPGRADAYLTNTIAVRFLLGICFLAVIQVAGGLTGFSPSERYLVFVYSLILVTDPFAQAPLVFSVALRRYGLAGVLELAQKTTLALLPLGALALGLALESFLWTSVAATVLGCLAFPFTLSVLRLRFPAAIQPRLIRTLAVAGLPIAISALFYAIETRIDRVMLSRMLDASAVGVYAVAGRILQVALEAIWAPMSHLYFPALSRAYSGSMSEFSAKLLKYFAVTLTICSGFSLIIAIASDPIIILLWGESYRGAADALKILIWASVTAALIQLMYQALIVINGQRGYLAIQLLTVSLNIVLNVIWIPNFGIGGAAWATLISSLAGAVSTAALVLWALRSRTATDSIVMR